MKYLKSYKLFESLVEDITFIRMSHTDMLEGGEEGWYQPNQRRMVGPDAFNDSLVKAGFPDKKNCVHFMSEESYDVGYSGIYGKNLFQVVIDDNSKLGWSFIVPINDWFYRNAKRKIELVSDIMESPFGQMYADSQTGEGVDESLNYLMDYKVIGTGTIEDLKRSPHFGKYNLYVWTTDKVYLKRYVKESEIKEKEPKPYKNQPVLNSEDFTNRGIRPEEIGNFYQSEWGRRFKRLQPTADYNLRREEALKLLDEWIKTR